MRNYRRPSRTRRVVGAIAAVLLVLLGVHLYLSYQAIFERHLLGLFGAPTYLPVKCWFENRGTREIDCGYLYVLEERDDPESAIIRLPLSEGAMRAKRRSYFSPEDQERACLLLNASAE